MGEGVGSREDRKAGRRTGQGKIAALRVAALAMTHEGRQPALPQQFLNIGPRQRLYHGLIGRYQVAHQLELTAL